MQTITLNSTNKFAALPAEASKLSAPLKSRVAQAVASIVNDTHFDSDLERVEQLQQALPYCIRLQEIAAADDEAGALELAGALTASASEWFSTSDQFERLVRLVKSEKFQMMLLANLCIIAGQAEQWEAALAGEGSHD